jgi:hypothetical protein
MAGYNPLEVLADSIPRALKTIRDTRFRDPAGLAAYVRESAESVGVMLDLESGFGFIEEEMAGKKERMEAVSALKDAGTEEIIEYLQHFGISPKYIQVPKDTRPVSTDTREGFRYVLAKLDPKG